MRNNNLEKISWTDVDSSNVGSIAFDDKTQTICVKFKNGGLYSYIGASEEIYMGLVHANSVGQYLNQVVKAFPYTRWESENDLLSHLNV